MILSKEKYSLIHLKNGLAIDADYRSIVKELFPQVFENPAVQKIIADYLKATE